MTSRFYAFAKDTIDGVNELCEGQAQYLPAPLEIRIDNWEDVSEVNKTLIGTRTNAGNFQFDRDVG